ncbi:MAG: DDE-type integrase/transposase/recombinase [Candidatus Competibacteraceae bacterium]|nr:DDE-type integrase/transposase/recombinase [Candidatus Competibacteraceae bacterium]
MSEAPGGNGRQLELYRLIERHLNQGVPIRRVAEEAGMTERQFYRLLKSYRAKGFAGISRKSRKDAGGRKVVTEVMQQLIEGLCLQRPKPSLSWVHKQVVQYCTKEAIKAPSYSVVWRIYEDIPSEHKVFAHEGEKAYKHEFGIIHRWSARAPNEIWQCDHKQFEIYAKDLRGRVGPVWLTAVEDDYSRAIMGYYIGIEPPSSKRIALALRQAIWHKPEENWPVCGLPEKFFSDHGSDFMSEHIEQVAADLKFELLNSAVGEAEPRGKIERLFRSADQEFIPGVKSPKTAPIAVEEVNKRFRAWLINEYMVSKQKDLSDEAPLDRWKADMKIPRMPNSEEELDLMLLHVGRQRKVQRDGLRFKTFRYFDLELSKYVTQWVSIRYDPSNMSYINVYADGNFVCKASCKELEGKETSLREIIKERAERKKEVKEAVQARQLLAKQSFCQAPPVPEKTAESQAKTEPPRRIFKYFYERTEFDNLSRN